MVSEESVDESRDALVRLHPVAVSAAEHAELGAIESVWRSDVLEPLDKVLCVVRGLAFVGSRHNEHGAVGRHMFRSHVQSLKGCTEAFDEGVSEHDVDRYVIELTMRRGTRHESLGKRFRTTGVRPIEHVQRVEVGVCTSCDRGRGSTDGVRLRPRRSGSEAWAILTRNGVNMEVVRLNSNGLLYLELVVGVVHDEVEVLENCHHSELSLLPGERTADARAHTKPKRLPGVGLVDK